MLPFIKKKNENSVASLLIQDRNLSEKPEENQEDDKYAAIEACASLLINAVHAHDVKAAAESICAAFEILESYPHQENVEPHSYDAQNIKAVAERKY